MVKEADAAPSTYTNEQLEECDMDNEEDVKLFVIDRKDGSITLEVCHMIAMTSFFEF